jgi:hypothetical protein
MRGQIKAHSVSNALQQMIDHKMMADTWSPTLLCPSSPISGPSRFFFFASARAISQSAKEMRALNLI